MVHRMLSSTGAPAHTHNPAKPQQHKIAFAGYGIGLLRSVLIIKDAAIVISPVERIAPLDGKITV